tara:strand:- start:158 stop:508 length:351 start_codon:yes stop_codon:yes gene_type:complete
MKGYKCLGYPQLKLAAWQSMKNEYNRQMDPDDITKEHCGLEKEDTVLFPIEMYMIHRHKQGVPCEAHARAFIITPSGKLCIDFEKSLFDSLPMMEVDGGQGTLELPEDELILTSIK